MSATTSDPSQPLLVLSLASLLSASACSPVGCDVGWAVLRYTALCCAVQCPAALSASPSASGATSPDHRSRRRMGPEAAAAPRAGADSASAAPRWAALFREEGYGGGDRQGEGEGAVRVHRRPLLVVVLGCVSQREVAACAVVCRAWAAAVASALLWGAARGQGGQSCWLNVDLQGSGRAASVVQRWPPSILCQVHRLSLLFCKRLGDEELRWLLRLLPSLADLDLGGCHALTDAALSHLSAAAAAPDVNDTARGERGAGGAARPSGRRALQRLSLYWCPQLTDRGVSALSAALDCEQLRQLSFSLLDLTRVERMTDDTLITVGSSCPSLRTLLLFSDAQMTDIGLIAVARGCPELRQLDLTGLRLCTDQAVVALAEQCPSLHSLTLQWCTALTDEALIALGEVVHSQLRSLSVHGCRLMTVEGLRALAKGAVRLEVVDLNGCALIPHRDAAFLHSLFPHLTTAVSL